MCCLNNKKSFQQQKRGARWEHETRHQSQDSKIIIFLFVCSSDRRTYFVWMSLVSIHKTSQVGFVSFRFVQTQNHHPSIEKMMRMNILISFAPLFCLVSTSADALSSPEASGFSLDRFRPSCPADPSCIHQFDPSLTSTDSPEAIWVAVYRSNNNKPSVFVRDEFFHSMNAATSGEDLQQQSVSSQQQKRRDG